MYGACIAKNGGEKPRTLKNAQMSAQLHCMDSLPLHFRSLLIFRAIHYGINNHYLDRNFIFYFGFINFPGNPDNDPSKITLVALMHDCMLDTLLDHSIIILLLVFIFKGNLFNSR